MLYERQLQKWKDSVKEWEDKGRSGKKPSKPQRPNVQGGRRIERGVSGMKHNRHECEETKNSYGWQRCVLRDFANIVMGQSPSSKTYNRRGDGLPFFQGKAEFGDVYPTINMYCSQPKKIAKQGATLLSVRAPVGPTNLVQHDCCIGRGLAAIHPCGGIQTKFLLYLLRSIEPAISGKGTGSTFKAITKEFVEGLEFNLPPLSEQQCIVAKIEEKLSVVEELYLTLDRQLQKGNFLRQSILKKAFAGQLVEQDPEDEPASVLLDRIRVERKKTMKNKTLKKKDPKKKQTERGSLNTTPIVSKVWSFCNTLRDDGVSYGDYLEQLTYLIFLKMGDEYSGPPYNRDVGIPERYNWQSLKSKRGAELEHHYVALLRELGTKAAMLGQIFTKSQNKIQDPAKLYSLIKMVDDTEWVTLDADIKGDIYEGLLERNAEEYQVRCWPVFYSARLNPCHG